MDGELAGGEMEQAAVCYTGGEKWKPEPQDLIKQKEEAAFSLSCYPTPQRQSFIVNSNNVFSGIGNSKNFVGC